jgi:hypothetical protein
MKRSRSKIKTKQELTEYLILNGQKIKRLYYDNGVSFDNERMRKNQVAKENYYKWRKDIDS